MGSEEKPPCSTLFWISSFIFEMWQRQAAGNGSLGSSWCSCQPWKACFIHQVISLIYLSHVISCLTNLFLNPLLFINIAINFKQSSVFVFFFKGTVNMSPRISQPVYIYTETLKFLVFLCVYLSLPSLVVCGWCVSSAFRKYLVS